MPRALLLTLLVAVSLGAAGCSMKKMGVGRMADALSATATAFSRDDDPEFVRIGAPSTLKMVEMLLDDQPSHPGLLLTACRGFTQYAYAFLQVEYEMALPQTSAGAREYRSRGVAMYGRARGYCFRALEVRHPGIRDRLLRDPKIAVASLTGDDVPALYWAAAAWGGSLTLSDSQLVRIGELAAVRAMMSKALQLDETWEGGAIHEAMIALEGLPVLLGGSPARARAHFERAVAISEGQSVFPYVTLATSVAQPAGDRAEFERLLRAALAVDVTRRPPLRLANLIAQKRARTLLARIDKLF